jgi:tetratricopeptide (TPR) repeat protein
MLFELRPRAGSPRIALTIIVTLALGVILFSPAALVRAQTAPKVGTQVVLKAGASLKVGNTIVERDTVRRVYTVEQSNGDWLGLVSGKVAGWVKAADVVPLSEAIDFYSKEIERNPHDPQYYTSRGIIHLHHRRLDDARADFDSALRQNPRFVTALINRGNIWLIKRDPDRAITDYTDAVDSDPKSVLAHLNRGIAYQAKGEYNNALADYDEAIKLGHHTAAGYSNRGHVRDMKKDHDGAIADFTEAIKLDPHYVLAWMNRAEAHKARGDYAEALADFAEASKLSPKEPTGYARRAWILATCPDDKIRNGKEAVALAEQAVALEKAGTAYYLDVKAAAYAEAGDFVAAIYNERQAINAAAAKKSGLEADTYAARLKLFEAKNPKPYREEK